MKVLLVGNYLPDRQYSMQLFAESVRKGLIKEGHQAMILRPPSIMGSLWAGPNEFHKWLCYIDKFILFPVQLRIKSKWADVIHICDQANSVYLSHLRCKAHVITCHDMMAIRSALGEIPESYVRPTGRILQRWILHNLSKAKSIVSTWNHTKDELIRICKLPGKAVEIAPHGLNYPYQPMVKSESESRLSLLGLDATIPYILHVGANQWYKNRIGVLRIFSHLRKFSKYKHYRLIMAGEPLTVKMKKIITELKLSPHIIELIDVSSEDLCALYSMAEGLLFPSLQEGFGWPIIEAQACGCPVFTSNIIPMNQIGGNSAVYFNPKDEISAARVIDRHLENRDSIVLAGLDNAARFSMQKMIKKYISVYLSAINSTMK